MKPLTILLVFLFLPLILPFNPYLRAADSTEYANRKLPFNSQLRDRIDATFYRDGKLSEEKIDIFRRQIETRRREIENNLEKFYRLKEDKTPKKAAKKADKDDFVAAYDILLDYIGQLPALFRKNRMKDFHYLALRVLEIEDALKVRGKKLASTMLFEKVPESMKKRKIALRAAPEGEAFNLIDPRTGLFYSQAQLAAMKLQGKDISLFNPPSDSTYWQEHDIESLDVKTHYQEGNDALHRGLGLIFPKNKGYFKKVRRTQTKPKLDIFFRHPETGKKVNFKLKVGAEMHSEPSASALFTALGFSADICKYVRDFKVVLGETTPFQFKREWGSYYSRYDVNNYIKKEGKDEEGHYIIFYEGLLEAKPKGLMRIGPWAYGKHGRKGLREVRAALLFNMWVSNIDLKESENNKLILRKIDGKDHYFHIQHDMGFAFGKTYIERPGEFKWTLVKRKSEDYIHLSYRCFQKNSGFEHITYADGRWLTRLIARLSREQIHDAIRLGGWPESMGLLLVEKLIARRNQLVKAFGLNGEPLPNGKVIGMLPYNPRLTTADKVVENGKLKVFRLPGYKQFFGPRIKELIPLILRNIRDVGVDWTVEGISSIRYFKLNPEWIGVETDVISRIRVKTDREIEPNPFPTGEDDQFLVRDTMSLGIRLGYGKFLSGDVSYIRKYTVVTPVRTIQDARFHKNFIISLTLPDRIKKFECSHRFAALVEDILEFRGRLKARPEDGSGLGADASLSKIYLDRYFINRRQPGKLIYFEDDGHLRQLAYKIYFQFVYLFHYRIPFFRRSFQQGKLKRSYVYLDIPEPGEEPGREYALKRLLVNGDSSFIKKLGTHKTIDDTFFQRKTKFNLFNIYTLRAIYRVDRLKVIEPSARGEFHYQVESHKRKTWRFFDNGERIGSSVRLTCRSTRIRSIKEPALTISYRISDKNATNGELKDWYIDFINKVSLDPRFIYFDPGSHTQNFRWGYLRMNVNIHFYQEAIDRILKLKGEEIWKALSEVTGQSVSSLKRSARPRYRRGSPVTRYRSSGGTSYLASKTAYLIRALKSARATPNNIKKIRLLLKAVRKAVYSKGHGFESNLQTALNRLIGKENFFIEASITMPQSKEMVFPERKPLYNRRGFKKSVLPITFEYIFDDPAEIYHMF